MIALDARRVIADLRELDRLTGGPEGARRVCWTDEWQRAREFLRGLLDEIDGVALEIDETGNLWAGLAGSLPGTVAVGSHIDSVPNGGWLDGALGVMTAVEVLRTAAADDRPRHGVTLVDFADEEGARFGRSLFGSSAVGGRLDPAAVAELRDADGTTLREAVAAFGVELERAPAAAARRAGLIAYLELHIEQGPVLEREGLGVAAVSGTFGVERHRFVFSGQASHAGTTPMDMRRDAGLAAAATALAISELPGQHGGVATTGVLRLEPGIVTAVAGRAELEVDLRNGDAGALQAALVDARAAARASAAAHGCELAEQPIWRIEPIPFDERLVAVARAEADDARVLASGALHDAAELAPHVPTAMMFTASTGGISHAREEDTPEADLERAIAAFGRLTGRVLAGDVVG